MEYFTFNFSIYIHLLNYTQNQHLYFLNKYNIYSKILKRKLNSHNLIRLECLIRL